MMENVGPIGRLDIELPFNQTGNPKPIVFMGENGTGKTIVLAHIIDALLEFACQAYSDILQEISLGHSYFKLTGPTNQRIGSNYGFCFLNFKDSGKSFQYIDKSGELSFSDCKSKTNALLNVNNNGWKDKENHKDYSQDEEYFKNLFVKNTFCFFPVNRFEIPHWLNTGALNTKETFSFRTFLAGKLDKPLVIISSLEETKSYLLDVILDYEVHKDSTVWMNANTLIKEIIGNNNVSFGVGPRTSNQRLVIGLRDKDGKWIETLIPSLNHLSTGQVVLLNLFSTIIRYSDRGAATKLEEAKGIVLIDEVDLHLHTVLQKDILPRLIGLFPKIQFILTTHSPVTVLGLKEKFGEDGFVMYQMPKGEVITAERFSEFEHAFNAYKNTKKFDEELEEQLRKASKALVFVEGITDEQYIKKAIQVFGEDALLDTVEIKFVGEETPRGSQSAGKSALDKAFNLLKANQKVINQRFILLYDFDTGKSNQDHENVYIRTFERNSANNKIRKGIENLFPEELFQEEFYYVKERDTEYGGKVTEKDLDKRKFCNYVCNEREINKDQERREFENFKQIIYLIKEVVKTSDINPPETNKTDT